MWERYFAFVVCGAAGWRPYKDVERCVYIVGDDGNRPVKHGRQIAVPTPRITPYYVVGTPPIIVQCTTAYAKV